jgi:hypothetical protein
MTRILAALRAWHIMVNSCASSHHLYTWAPLFQMRAPYERNKAAAARMFSKAKMATFLMFRRCYTMGLHNVSTQLHMFDSLVWPILKFGCEIWGPSVLNNKMVATSHECETWHRSVLKQILGVCTSTTNHIVMEELNRFPLCFEWLKQALRFWNKKISMVAKMAWSV